MMHSQDGTIGGHPVDCASSGGKSECEHPIATESIQQLVAHHIACRLSMSVQNPHCEMQHKISRHKKDGGNMFICIHIQVRENYA
jgi:hypothetical protein